jgi:uroporphyrinogen-III synthase
MRLINRVVVTTRDGSPDDPLTSGLRSEGARVCAWPTLTFASTEASVDILSTVSSYDWIVFTSPRAVTELASAGVPFRDLHIAAVGRATTTAVEENGGHVTVVGSEGSTVLADTLVAGYEWKGTKVLFPASELAGPAVQRALIGAGADVHRVNVYRTIPCPPDPDQVRADLARGVDVVTFASPSAVVSLADGLGGEWPSALRNVAVAAIGSTTSEALRKTGVGWVKTAPHASLEGLIEACVSLTRNGN